MIRSQNLISAWKAYGLGKMRKATLKRYETGKDGTFGDFTTDSGFACYTLEKAWMDNTTDFSCIPPGTYKCDVAASPRFGKVYHVRHVKGRTDILIHSANLERELRGCIAPGRAVGTVLGSRGVMSSKDALAALMADLDNEPFELTITWEPALVPEKTQPG